MKLARFSTEGGPRLGLVHDDEIVDLAAAGLPFASLDEIIRAADHGLELVKKHADGPRRPLAEAKLIAPMSRPGKYLAIAEAP